ncbi:FAR1-related sequence 5-like protein [Tanacetum coccineum]
MEIVIPEVGRIEDDILLIKDDTLRETLLNVNRLVAKIEALKDNPVPSSVVVTKSTSTFPNLFLEETNTFDNSLPELETFCFNLEEPSSGSPTTHSELSLPDYKAFYIDNDHFKEKSSGSTTTHVDFSQYDSFIFDLSINSYHPSNRSDFHEEFADELAQIISQPEYDCFFKDEPELGNLTMDVVGNIFQERVRGKGTYYDTVDEAIDMYTKYVEMGGFEVKKSGQRLTKSGAADEVAKCNYKEFGDIVSFDTTFNNNKYNMKFVPFINVDNHEKCVTLGSGMLLHEDTKSYTWLLKAFMTAFLKEPTMIVTYQDGAMKRAIESVLTKAKHRLCMWNIMQRIPSNIPPYFIDSPLFGLMRTTSRSESENSFFKSFTSSGATLVSFLMSYESAMERQRYRQEALDFKTIDAAPKDKKPNDNRALNTKKGKEQEKKTGTVAETVRDYKNRDINVIPKQYILRCWTRDIIPPDLRRQRNIYGENVTIERFTNEAKNLVDDCLFLLSKDEGKMGAFVEKLKVLMEEVKADVQNPPSRNIGDVIGGIFSISKPNQIVVQNPTKAVNKVEHLKKGDRLKSEREKTLKVRAKKLNVYGYCKEKTNEHTKTTCPLNRKAKKKKKATPIIDV